jgi:hypothetical protein
VFVLALALVIVIGVALVPQRVIFGFPARRSRFD